MCLFAVTEHRSSVCWANTLSSIGLYAQHMRKSPLDTTAAVASTLTNSELMISFQRNWWQTFRWSKNNVYLMTSKAPLILSDFSLTIITIISPQECFPYYLDSGSLKSCTLYQWSKHQQSQQKNRHHMKKKFFLSSYHRFLQAAHRTFRSYTV